MKPMMLSDIKCYNRKLVFETLRQQKEISRSELSRVTGISLPTVFKVVQDFTAKGIIIPCGETSGNLGRKALNLRFNPDAYYVAGVELEGTRMRMGLFNLVGELRASLTQDTEPGFTPQAGRLISESLVALTADLGTTLARIAALGIGFPGVVDTESQVVRFAPLVGITSPLAINNVLNAIQRETQLTARIENDANAAAYGEMIARSPDHTLSLLYLSLGTGLGGGLILDGQLRRGPHFLVGEIGYWLSDPGQRATMTEQGSLEERINLHSLMDRFGYVPGGGASQEMIDYLVEHLTLPIANAVNLLDIEMVVFNGIVFEDIASSFIPALKSAVAPMTLSGIHLRAARALQPGSMGAAMLAFHESLEKWLGMDSPIELESV